MSVLPEHRSIRWKIVALVFFVLVFQAVIVYALTRLKIDLIVSLIAGSALPLVAAIFIAKRFSKPLRDIAEKTERLLLGDFSKPAEVRTYDEIGWLASKYNRLRKMLHENFSEITSEKEKMETVLRQMADGMVAVDPMGRFVHVNDAARAILHITDEDIHRKRYDDIILRFSDTLKLNGIRRSLERGENDSGFSYGGRTYDVRYDRFWDVHGNEGGVIISLQDVTERQKIDNMQIDFVANVSHELKTPLTSIKGYTETLLDGGVDDPDMARDFLTIINSETDRMNRMVKDLLQLSRLDTHQQKFDMRPEDIVKLVAVAIRKVNMMAKSKQQYLNILFNPEQTIYLKIDRDRIEQVVLNILSNAIKYTNNRGRIDVDIYVRAGTVRIVVMDNGIGIPESELSRVFERFFRVDRSRSAQNIAGTGLGLPISKQIVEGHGGAIELASQFGKGTKVTIVLPLPKTPITPEHAQ